jgi:PadR family transcriptional regulator PadR
MENRAQFLKGVARTLVLGLLRERPMYGYEIATALAARSEGVFALGQGTLYPLLYSLEGKGLIRVSREEEAPGAGRRRCYYRLTPAGKAELEANLLTWGQIARGMKLVLGGGAAYGA